jgi:serine/threonine-protein kinase RsbW
VATEIFPGRLDSLEKISEFVQQVARSACFNDRDVYAVQLAVDEACTNIIEHAYHGKGGNITCTCDVDADGLKIILLDQAAPFQPDAWTDPDLGLPLEQVKSRGLGLFLMRRMMDDVKFEKSPEGGNCLTMIKRRK